MKRKKKANGDFFDRVYEIARCIPYGRVTTYGAIAKAAGTGLSARMVGWAMNKSGSVAPPVPAHRVVNRNGILTGKFHFDSPGLMQQLLENEGLEIKDDKILRFNDHFWDPTKDQQINLKS